MNQKILFTTESCFGQLAGYTREDGSEAIVGVVINQDTIVGPRSLFDSIDVYPPANEESYKELK